MIVKLKKFTVVFMIVVVEKKFDETTAFSLHCISTLS